MICRDTILLQFDIGNVCIQGSSAMFVRKKTNSYICINIDIGIG